MRPLPSRWSQSRGVVPARRCARSRLRQAVFCGGYLLLGGAGFAADAPSGSGSSGSGSGAPAADRVTEALLHTVVQQIAGGRIISPPEDNAMQTWQRVLQRDIATQRSPEVLKALEDFDSYARQRAANEKAVGRVLVAAELTVFADQASRMMGRIPPADPSGGTASASAADRDKPSGADGNAAPAGPAGSETAAAPTVGAAPETPAAATAASTGAAPKTAAATTQSAGAVPETPAAAAASRRPEPRPRPPPRRAAGWLRGSSGRTPLRRRLAPRQFRPPPLCRLPEPRLRLRPRQPLRRRQAPRRFPRLARRNRLSRPGQHPRQVAIPHPRDRQLLPQRHRCRRLEASPR